MSNERAQGIEEKVVLPRSADALVFQLQLRALGGLHLRLRLSRNHELFILSPCLLPGQLLAVFCCL